MVQAKWLVTIWVCLISTQCASGHSIQDRFFDSNGARIRYQVWGQGPSVVLIHGFGETLESWHRTKVVEVLSRHFQVIAIDVRGHGHSSKPHDQKSYGPELSADIVHLLRHLGKSKAHIVGYSMGGLIALDFAVFYPKHALSVVLGGAGWNPPETLDDFRRQAEAYERGDFPVRAGDDPKALAGLLRGLGVLSAEQVQSIRVPMAALIGTNDRFMPSVQRLSRALPDMEVRVIKDANHATAPGQPKFAAELLALLLKQRK